MISQSLCDIEGAMMALHEIDSVHECNEALRRAVPQRRIGRRWMDPIMNKESRDAQDLASADC
jgi:hypothetical protein